MPTFRNARIKSRSKKRVLKRKRRVVINLIFDVDYIFLYTRTLNKEYENNINTYICILKKLR